MPLPPGKFCRYLPALFLVLAPLHLEAQTPPPFDLKWGTDGSGDGQFVGPRDVALDSSGNVYVVDSNNDRIQKFDSNGTFLTKWGKNLGVGGPGSSGSGDGEFAQPQGVEVDGSGNVYVADTNNHRIQKFDNTGAFLAKWGTNGSGDGQFTFPSGVTVDGTGNVYVTDQNNHRIQIFDSSGNFLLKWGSFGSGDGQFSFPRGTAVDVFRNIYVADPGNKRVQKFSEALLIPTLTEWGIILLILALAVAAIFRVKKLQMA